MKNAEHPEHHLALFKGKTIRRAVYKNEERFELSTICRQLKNAHWIKLGMTNVNTI